MAKKQQAKKVDNQSGSEKTPDSKDSILKGLPKFIDWATFNLPPNIKTFPLSYYANFTKSTMFIVLSYMMWHYKNYSPGAFIYLALHSSYGLMWNLKTLAFPDKSHLNRVSIGSLPQLFIVLGFYYYLGYYMMSGKGDQFPTSERICLSICLMAFGAAFMIATDCQKYFTLKYKKGLISDGMMARSRNMNYVGEMMIYGSLAYLNNSYALIGGLVAIWSTIFALTMLAKEVSYRQKEGWEEYSKKSWILLPKPFTSDVLSIISYSLLAGIGYYIYSVGGIRPILTDLSPYVKEVFHRIHHFIPYEYLTTAIDSFGK